MMTALSCGISLDEKKKQSVYEIRKEQTSVISRLFVVGVNG
jgi:hypothetical protein